MARVFISYSHDSPEHRDDVLVLAKQLLAAGHHVTLDRFTAHPDPNWPQWMAREILAADVVLCICTATYRQRFEGTPTGGFGVAWEGHLITTELYRMKGRPGRFIPVEVEEDAVPLTLRGLPVVTFDSVVAHLGGTVGPALKEPEVYAGGTEAMSVGALVGPIWKPLRPPRSTEGYAPTQLLRAEHAVVPFLGRAQQVQDIEEWCGGGGVRVRVVHGPGGAGKTRLSFEIAANRCREGWRAGPLAVWRDAHAPVEYLDALFRDKIPLFLIVDYAETRAEVLVPLLQRLAKVEDASARVLLVARAKGDWWDRAMAEVPELDRMSFGWPDVRVDEVEAGVEHAKEAAASFAAWLDRPVPPTVRDYGRTALERQVEALVAVLGVGPLEGMAQLLRHEDRFLLNAGALAGVPDAVGRLLPKLMALVTLAGGLGAADVRGWMPAVDGLDDLLKAEARAVVELLGDLYPRDGRGVDGMRPDRVGEALVAREDEDGRLAEVAVDRGRGKAALTVLTRLGATGDEGPLRRLIDARREGLVEEVIVVAQETGDPVGRVMADSLESHPASDLAARLDEHLPVSSVTLRELAEVAARHALRADETDEVWAQRLSRLAVRLGDLGDRRTALTAIEEAVAVQRRLAAMDPRHRGSLAGSLNNLAVALRHLGRRHDALRAAAEAVAINRQRGLELDADPARLAMSLGALSVNLVSVGRHQEALDAIVESLAIFRGLDGGSFGFDSSNVPKGLVILSNVLGTLGRRRDAAAVNMEAVEAWRHLVREHPNAFLPDLVMSLNNLSQKLAELGIGQHALAAIEEAVALARTLASSRPRAFLPDVASCLNTQSAHLGRAGRYGEAISVSGEAVAVYRRLSTARPDAALPELAMSLNNLALNLSYGGRHREAVTAIEEAVRIRRGLTASDPDAFAHELATSLWAMAVIHFDTAPSAAATSAADCLSILVPLGRDRPAAFANKSVAVQQLYRRACTAAGVAPDQTLLTDDVLPH